MILLFFLFPFCVIANDFILIIVVIIRLWVVVLLRNDRLDRCDNLTEVELLKVNLNAVLQIVRLVQLPVEQALKYRLRVLRLVRATDYRKELAIAKSLNSRFQSDKKFVKKFTLVDEIMLAF